MQKDLIKKQFDEYLLSFQNKNIIRLSKLFDEEITLTDWEINAVGKESVIEANKKIFNSVKIIKIELINLILEDQILAAEMLLNIDNHLNIKVVDVISFTKKGKIKSITAYKG